MWRGKSWYLVVLACVVGCNGKTTSRTMNSELERNLTALLAERKLVADDIDCHTHGFEPQIGAAVICQVRFGETDYGLRWTITSSDNAGRFRGKMAWIDDEPVNMREIENGMAEGHSKVNKTPVTVDCGGPTIQAVAPSTRYYCDATIDGRVERVSFNTEERDGGDR